MRVLKDVEGVGSVISRRPISFAMCGPAHRAGLRAYETARDRADGAPVRKAVGSGTGSIAEGEAVMKRHKISFFRKPNLEGGPSIRWLRRCVAVRCGAGSRRAM
jgi:hypothetical protein